MGALRSGGLALSRPGRGALERALGAALGVLAVVFALPAAAAVLAAVQGEPTFWAAGAASAALAAGCGWLAARLWSARGLPGWLSAWFVPACCGGVGAWALADGQWWYAAYTGLMVVLCWPTRPRPAAG